MVKVNGALFGDKKFHNGESIYSQVPLHDDVNIIEMRFSDNSDITNMVMAKLWIDREKPNSHCILESLYMPYSRMDRAINEQLFSMQLMADLINSLHFSHVNVLDLHAPATSSMINNFRDVPMDAYVREVVMHFGPDVIAYPDKGAYEKYRGQNYGEDIPVIHGNKKRDLANKGRLTGDYSITNDEDANLKGARVLIVDDICCLGGTAYLMGKELKNLGVSKVGLYISHCENGVFFGNLLKAEADGSFVIDRIYTAGTMPLEAPNDPSLHIDHLYTVDFKGGDTIKKFSN